MCQTLPTACHYLTLRVCEAHAMMCRQHAARFTLDAMRIMGAEGRGWHQPRPLEQLDLELNAASSQGTMLREAEIAAS